MQDNNAEELEGICANCIGDPFLKELVKRDDDTGKCYYCQDIGQIISLEDFAEHVGAIFTTHYERTAIDPDGWEYTFHKEKSFNYEWERSGEQTVEAIERVAKIPYEAACNIQEMLETEYYDFEEAKMGMEQEFSSEAFYERTIPKDVEKEWKEKWLSFEKEIKSKARFFNRKAEEQLSELFDIIGEMRTQNGTSPIIDVGPNTELTHLYRARVFQSDKEIVSAMKRPDKELSAPPSPSAGRMNAQGISVFYGATSHKTAIAEVRPPVGSKVLVARFEIIRPLRLLKLSALGNVGEEGSIFDPEHDYRLGRALFLYELSRRIIRPVMPNDQASDYLPTQAIADFLATEGETPLDGILYESVQDGANGLNVVLFHKAARCKELEFPEGTEFRVNERYFEDNFYNVDEKFPPETETLDEKNPRISVDSSDYDERAETLSIDLESMRVHYIKGIQIYTTENKVSRSRVGEFEDRFEGW